jgi:curved DNA-binding protein CbpA
MDRDPKGYYANLFLTPNASMAEIKSSYRKLARKYHPDVNAGDKWAEETFKKLNEAYEVLSNSNKRWLYDPAWKSGAPSSTTSAGQQQAQPTPRWNQRPGNTPPPKPPPPPKNRARPPGVTGTPSSSSRHSSTHPRSTVAQPNPSFTKIIARVVLVVLCVGIAAIVLLPHGDSAAQRIARDPSVEWAVNGSSFNDSSEPNDASDYRYHLSKSVLVISSSERIIGLDRVTGKQLWSWDKTDCSPYMNVSTTRLIGEGGGYLWFGDKTSTCRLNPITGHGLYAGQVSLRKIVGNFGLEKTSDYSNTPILKLPSLYKVGVLPTDIFNIGSDYKGYDVVIPGATIHTNLDSYTTVLKKLPGSNIQWSYKASAPLSLVPGGYSNHVLLFHVMRDRQGSGNWSTSGIVIALDRQTGDRLWSKRLKVSQAVPDGRLWILTSGPANKRRSTVLDSETGRAQVVRGMFDQDPPLVSSGVQIIAIRGGRNPQAAIRTNEGNLVLYLRTARAAGLMTTMSTVGDLTNRLMTGLQARLETGDRRDLIVLRTQGNSTVLMLVSWKHPVL